MFALLRRPSRTQLLGFGIIALMTLPIYGEPPKEPDRTKREVVEKGAAGIVKNSNPAAPANPIGIADMTKTVRIERPMKAIVQAAAAAPNSTTAPAKDSENPTVKAGDVKWHANFAEACKAAQKSGKPVLLFHMMGELDKQFC